MQSGFPARLRFSSAFFYVMVILITFQTMRLQLSPLQPAAEANSTARMMLVEPERGLIYDRYGHLLAGNKTVYEVGVDLNQIASAGNAATVARVLSQILDFDYGKVYETVNTAPSSGSGGAYRAVTNFATSEQMNQINDNIKDFEDRAAADKKLGLADTLYGVHGQPHSIRTYPESSLASNILGYTSQWGESYLGLEKQYDALLSGTPVYVPMADSAHIFTADYQVPSGANLVLTIDRDIQAAMEKIIDDSVENTGAELGVLIVMDPTNGEILAMATNPRADLNKFSEFKHDSFNPAIDYSYEPGSVFKIFTMAGALDAGTVTPDTPFMDSGSITVGGSTFQNWHRLPGGPQTMTTCMENSLNVCLASVAVDLGTDRFYNYLKAFRIGRSTNIDLAGESVWPLRTPNDEKWTMDQLGANAFGQSVMTTPIQMVMAASALANDGQIVAPHVVKSYEYGGMQQVTSVTVVNSPITKKAAHDISDMLAISMEGETYQAAVIDGYKIAGKTGTAQIAEKGVFLDETNTSFIGWGPVDDPKFLVYIWLNKPTSDSWASTVVSPIFKHTVEELVVLMNIPPDAVRQDLLANLSE